MPAHIDEVHIFIAPKLIGGHEAPSPIAGAGLDQIASSLQLGDLEVTHSGEDLHVHGLLRRMDPTP